MTKAKTPGNSQQVILSHWCMKEIETREGTRSRHIIGHDITNDLGRASTAIVSFDYLTMTATTRSGSRYILKGQPGNSNLGMAAWEKWRTENETVSESDVTEEYLQTDGQNTDTTVTFTKLKRRRRLNDKP